MSPLAGRVAVVTGASRGIGAAVARRLARDGLRVACVGRDRAALEEVAAACCGVALVADVTGSGAAEAILQGARAHFDAEVDVVVANAGVETSAKLERTTDEIWDRLFATNATAVFRLCRAALPSMIARGFGRVVVVASNAGLVGYPYTSAYCASKHAVVGLTRALAAEVAKSSVTINAVCPGFVDTEMAGRSIAKISSATGRSEEAARASLAKMSPQERLIEPDEVAYLVAALLPHEARGIHGQAIAIDGGQTFG